MQNSSHSNREGSEYEKNHKFRFQQYSSGGDTAASRLRSPFTAGIVPAPLLLRLAGERRGGFFFTLNRVVPGHRMGGPSRDEGMATGNATHTACLKSCSQVALIAKAGRCNTGRRNESSVGNGNHCARVFKREAKRPTVVCVEITRNTKSLLNRLRGGFARSLPPIVLNQTVHDN